MPTYLKLTVEVMGVNEFITYATVNSGQEGRICGRPKMIDKEPITGRSP